MYQKRNKKLVKRGSNRTLLREARRQQRIQMLTSGPIDNVKTSSDQMSDFDRISQNRLILELAWKTIALMHKNKLIQQKIIALRQETAEFIANVLNNPENYKKYQEYIRITGIKQITPHSPNDYDNEPMPDDK